MMKKTMPETPSDLPLTAPPSPSPVMSLCLLSVSCTNYGHRCHRLSSYLAGLVPLAFDWQIKRFFWNCLFHHPLHSTLDTSFLYVNLLCFNKGMWHLSIYCLYYVGIFPGAQTWHGCLFGLHIVLIFSLCGFIC